MRACLLIMLLSYLFVLAPGAGAAQTPQRAQSSLEGAKSEVEKLIAASGAELVGVAVYDLETKQSLLVKERAGFHAASTLKLPRRMEVCRRADTKRIRRK